MYKIGCEKIFDSTGLSLSSSKRGQLSIFIIIGIVIVTGVVLYFVFNKPLNKPNGGNTINVGDVLDQCLKETAQRGVLKIGEQGGYYILEENKTFYSFPYLTSYYLKDGKNLVLSKENIEKQIGFYIDDNLQACFDENLKTFETQGFNLSYGNIKSSVIIKENSIDIKTNMNLIASKGDSNDRFDKIDSNIKPVRLLVLLDLSNKIVNEQVQDTRKTCISVLGKDANESGVKINVYKTGNKNDFVYVISDPLSNFSCNAYNFTFAAEYNFLNCKTSEECLNELAK